MKRDIHLSNIREILAEAIQTMTVQFPLSQIFFFVFYVCRAAAPRDRHYALMTSLFIPFFCFLLSSSFFFCCLFLSYFHSRLFCFVLFCFVLYCIILLCFVLKFFPQTTLTHMYVRSHVQILCLCRVPCVISLWSRNK